MLNPLHRVINEEQHESTSAVENTEDLLMKSLLQLSVKSTFHYIVTFPEYFKHENSLCN